MMGNKPLIERAITQARAAGQGHFSPKMLYQRFLAEALTITHAKYRWSASALTMVQYLFNDEVFRSGHFQAVMPGNHIWMEFEQPVEGVAALMFLLFSDASLMLKVARSFNPPPEAYEHLRTTYEQRKAAGEVVWMILLFDEQGTITWSIGFHHQEDAEQFVDFIETPFQHCPTGECVKEVETDRTRFCKVCAHTLAYWIAWAATAYHLLSGAFQEQEEPQEPCEIVERSLVKEPRKDRPHKYRDVEREHRYRYITFDACVRKVRRPASSQTQENGTYDPSWLAETLEVDPESVVYVDHAIASFTRQYRHARYIHMRGQRQSVQAHHKRIPVKLRNLGKVMTRVVASSLPLEAGEEAH